jgi:hypothetical protein
MLASVVPPAPVVGQFIGSGGLAQCGALGGGGLTSAGLQSGGLSQIYGFGAGSFYGPYSNPAYSSYGFGTIGGFLDFRTGQPSALAAFAASPYCQGLGINAPAPTGGAFVVRDFGLFPSPISGFVGAGYGSFGMSPFGMGGVGGAGGFGGASPFGFGAFGFR